MYAAKLWPTPCSWNPRPTRPTRERPCVPGCRHQTNPTVNIPSMANKRCTMPLNVSQILHKTHHQNTHCRRLVIATKERCDHAYAALSPCSATGSKVNSAIAGQGISASEFISNIFGYPTRHHSTLHEATECCTNQIMT